MSSAVMRYVVMLCLFFCYACGGLARELKELKFATTDDYFPFSFKEGDVMRGYDIELARLIAKELGRGATFEVVKFAQVFSAVDAGVVDAGIATISITEHRKQKFGFSRPYFYEDMAAVFHKERPIKDISELVNKKIACQGDTSVEHWLRNNVHDAEIMSFDDHNDVLRALGADSKVDVAIVDASQGRRFTSMNGEFLYFIVDNPHYGYGVLVRRDSILSEQINRALDALEDRGELERLQYEWLDGLLLA